MSLYKGLGAGAVVMLMSSAFLIAARPAATGDAEKAAARPRTRITKPWSELKDLTASERTSILEIHQKAVEEKKAIDLKEHQDILALLTPDQKQEVSKIEENEKRMARQARSRTPTTRPSGDSEN